MMRRDQGTAEKRPFWTYICFVVYSGSAQSPPPCPIIKSNIWYLEEKWNSLRVNCQDSGMVRYVTRGARGEQFPGSRMTAGTPKSPNNVTSTFFSEVHLLPNVFVE